MSISILESIPLCDAASRLMELAAEVVPGSEKLLTKNGTAVVAFVDARKLDAYHALERRYRRSLLLLAVAEEGTTTH